MDILRQLLAIGAAATLAWAAYRIARGLHIERGAASRVTHMIDPEERSAFDRYGLRLERQPFLSLDAWREHLDLAQINGKFGMWSVGGILARSLVYGAGALFYLLLLHPPLFTWLLLPGLLYLPFMRVRSAANDTRKLVTRLLPETATVVAAEMSAGASPDQALERASELPGPLGVLLRRAVAETRQSKRPMFSRGAAQGVVVESLARSRLTPLTRFGMQLDRVAAKGVEGPRVMGDIARGFSREYRAQVQMAAASLDNQLLLPITLFYFMPFLAAILLPVMISLLRVF